MNIGDEAWRCMKIIRHLRGDPKCSDHWWFDHVALLGEGWAGRGVSATSGTLGFRASQTKTIRIKKGREKNHAIFEPCVTKHIYVYTDIYIYTLTYIFHMYSLKNLATDLDRRALCAPYTKSNEHLVQPCRIHSVGSHQVFPPRTVSKRTKKGWRTEKWFC